MSNFNTNLIQNSILNTDSVKYLDGLSPFTFFDFLKNTNSTSTPTEYNDQYQEYLRKWYENKNLSESDVVTSIRDRYVELLKDISLNYTTKEEKRFFQNIDYDDDLDLAVIIPFFSRKIREICQFYKEKREKVKTRMAEVKYTGTDNSITRAIFGIITDFLFVDDSDESFKTTNIALSTVTSQLSIEVDELFDLYSNYFDLDPSSSSSIYNVQNVTRKNLFTSNVNDIEYDLFINFDKALKESIFQNFYIAELGKLFYINFELTKINLDCKATDPFYTQIQATSDEKRQYLELKKKLIRKYIGTDYYYLSTGSTISNYTSGIFVEADNAAKNVLNSRYPSTATVPEDSELYTLRQLGLYFTPDKTGILSFNSNKTTYKVDTTALEPNKIYIFPDPAIYGNVDGQTKNHYDSPLIYIIDNSKSVKHADYFYIDGDIKDSPFVQNLFGYSSTQQLNNTNAYGISGLNTDFQWIYNEGLVTKWYTDIYGNQYCHIVGEDKRTYTIGDQNVNATCQTWYGWYFYDDIEAYQFNYSTTGLIGTTIRTGLTSNTHTTVISGYKGVINLFSAVPSITALSGAGFTIPASNGQQLTFSFDIDNTGLKRTFSSPVVSANITSYDFSPDTVIDAITAAFYANNPNNYQFQKVANGVIFALSSIAPLSYTPTFTGSILNSTLYTLCASVLVQPSSANIITTDVVAYVNTISTFVAPSFLLDANAYYLYMREFFPFEDCESSYICSVYDGGGFAFNLTQTLPEPILVDDITWTGNENYYYKVVIDGGIGSISPFTRAIIFSPTLSGNLTYSYVTSSSDYQVIDGQYFEMFCDDPNTYNYIAESPYYIDDVSTFATTQFDPLTTFDNTSNIGSIYCKDIVTGVISPLSSKLQNIFSKYSDTVQTELYTSATNLIVYRDIIAITTPNYFVIDKIVYDGDIQVPNTSNNVINLNVATKISEPFFNEKTDYCIFYIVTGVNVNSVSAAYIPIIYKYTFGKNIERQYPTTLGSVSSQYIHNTPIKIHTIQTPVITYNSRNNVYALTYIGNDSNEVSYIYKVPMTYTTTLTVGVPEFYTSVNSICAKTINFYDGVTFSSASILSSSPVSAGQITFNNQTGVVQFYV